MTHRSGTLSLVAACIGALLSVGAPADAATSTGVLSGTVRASETGKPIYDVRVCAGSGADRRCDVTDGDGKYALRVVRGSHVVRARDASTYSNHVAAEANGGRPIRIGARRTVDFSLLAGATIEGGIRPGGTIPPHVDYVVRAYGVQRDGGVALTPSGASETFGDGTFRVNQLPAGRWVLGIEEEGAPMRWFGASSLASTAPRFAVTTGQAVEVGDTDFAPTGTLRVRPTYNGRTIRSGLQLYDADGRRVESLLPVRDSRTGAYAFAGLTTGDYRIRLDPEVVTGSRWEWFGGSRLRSARRVGVVAGSVTRQDTPVHPPRLRATHRPTIRLASIADFVGLRWNVRPGRSTASIEYSWYRDRRLVDRHLGDSGHFTREGDVGHRLRVCVLAHRHGYVDGRVCSRLSRTVTWEDFKRE